MPLYTLPPKTGWVQLNKDNTSGSLYATRNIYLDIQGKLSLSKKGHAVHVLPQGIGDLTALSIVFGSFSGDSNSYYYVLTPNALNRYPQDFSGYSNLGNNSRGTEALADAVAWNGSLHVSWVNGVDKYSGGSWTSNEISGLNGNNPHPLCASSVNNYLLVGDGNLVKGIKTDGTAITGITIPANYQIQWIRSGGGRTFLGCLAIDNTNAAVFEWDELAVGANYKYDIDASAVLSGAFLNYNFYIVTSDGRLLRFNGGGFGDNGGAQFPIYKTLKGQWIGFQFQPNLYQRGMAAVEGKLLINICARVFDADVGNFITYNEFPSGVWQFDPGTGLQHKCGISDSNNPNSYLENYVTNAGAISAIYHSPTSTAGPAANVGSSFLAGANGLNNDGTAAYILYSPATGDNIGQFITPRIQTNQIGNIGNKLWVKFEGVNSPTDQIILKYRYMQKPNLPFTTSGGGVYFNATNRFYSTDGKFQYASKGDEVTINNGSGSGFSAHIKDISFSSGTYTVTLDEAIPSMPLFPHYVFVTVDNWIKLETTITSADTVGYKSIPLEQASEGKWIQIKPEMRGASTITIEQLLLLTSEQTLVTN